jgi:hypothetical protein
LRRRIKGVFDFFLKIVAHSEEKSEASSDGAAVGITGVIGSGGIANLLIQQV